MSLWYVWWILKMKCENEAKKSDSKNVREKNWHEPQMHPDDALWPHPLVGRLNQVVGH